MKESRAKRVKGDQPTAEMRETTKAAQALRAAKSVYLSGHVRPDGDCLGSALALRVALRRMGKRADLYSRDPVPEDLSALPGASDVIVGRNADRRYDAAVFLECSSIERAGGTLDPRSQAGTVIHIDSHLRSKRYGDINIIEPEVSSTAEQVWRLIKALKQKVDKPVATCLYVGLVTDTGRFHYSNTTPTAFRFAAELLEAGVEAPELNDRLFGTLSYPALKLLGRSLDRLRLAEDGRVAVQVLSAADFADAGANANHTEDIVNFGMMVPGVEVSLILKEEQSLKAPEGRPAIRVSLRARGAVDVSAVAAEFGGGGHKNAAGCTLYGGLGEAESRLLAAVRKQL